jgi:hypothetical protein
VRNAVGTAGPISPSISLGALRRTKNENLEGCWCLFVDGVSLSGEVKSCTLQGGAARISVGVLRRRVARGELGGVDEPIGSGFPSCCTAAV